MVVVPLSRVVPLNKESVPLSWMVPLRCPWGGGGGSAVQDVAAPKGVGSAILDGATSAAPYNMNHDRRTREVWRVAAHRTTLTHEGQLLH